MARVRYLTRRSGFWVYARRVPLEVADRDRRGVVKVSTGIRIADDPRGIAAAKAIARIDADHQLYWRGLAAGDTENASTTYAAARATARSLGFEYVPAAQLARFADVMPRAAALMDKPLDEGTAKAAFGLVGKPEMRLSGLFEEYEKLSRASLVDLSPDQLRKWGNPKKRALANLIEVIGDKAIADITRNDALDFQGWWQDRILSEGVEIATANKDVGHLNRMFRTLDQRHRLGLEAVFAQLRIDGERTASRAAFEAKFVQDKILADGALSTLNPEARRVLYLMAETGLRLSEACNLTANRIILKAKVPHIQVRPDGRRMKTEQSERDVPLVGVALMAMKAQPEGFPRYRDKAASLSALVSKFFENNKLRPTPQHSAYSLRHTFEDRLTAVEAPEKLIAALMGHKYSRPKYGAGPSLEQKATWLRKIAFKPPASV
ncbi:integrase family protein [Ancylobacter novellus DSM 506]|uniref:Integrase family protein n=1 Tax=Ancylobacter novellus (strain ATCC 8093 / DSM 506 / JCM 20403 / CCM 1077 / IAM 12100 / NBRC 12443 / NCIMB 10456) TaxID=639283 RepID=D7A2U7_ANCN5|nr:tyrosine-type recombinase/integrase [Ancylobacter novellus]ADH91627.1 integrase family protein [Ancylobacter novellus DSM 506]